MSSQDELKFQYANRWSNLPGGLIVPPEVLAHAETHDRQLEDYLNTLNAGGGTAQSVLAWNGSTSNHDDDPSTGGVYTDNTLAFAVPSDSSFDYYLDWYINGTVQNNSVAAQIVASGYAKIYEQSPGVSYELTYGFYTGDNAPDGIQYVTSGFGHRMEKVSSDLLGTTIHMSVTFVVICTVSQRLRSYQAWDAKLIAIPK